MNRSESIKNIAAALALAQGELKNPPNSADNPFFKSKYAPLNEILNLARPILAKHGLSIIQLPGGDGTNISVVTMIMHSSGEFIESDPFVVKAEKVNAQGAGSAITYARRYTLAAMLNITSEDDDDGNVASGNKDKGKQNNGQQNKPSGNNDFISTEQARRIFAIASGDTELCKSIVEKYGYKSSKEIKKTDYEKICNEIEAEISKQAV